jgi:general secretion pathway protein N
MKNIWSLIALGIGAFVLFALVTLPADIVTSRFKPAGITLTGVSGTLWNGRAQAVRGTGDAHLGSVEWKLNILSLFKGSLGADVKIARTDGFAQASITTGPAGRVSLQALNASLPIATLPQSIVPGGWSGMLSLKFQQLTIEKDWPVAATGTLEAVDLTGPANRPVDLGSYRIVFPAQGVPAADTLTGTLSDTGAGPLIVTGKVLLKKNRSYLIDGLIATRPGAPGDMTKTLEFLGEPDGQGRRPFTFEGTM